MNYFLMIFYFTKLIIVSDADTEKDKENKFNVTLFVPNANFNKAMAL